MVKLFYKGLVSMRYSIPMTMNVFVIFALAFAYVQRSVFWVRPVMGAMTVLLAVQMFFYYRNKFRIAGVLRRIDRLEEFEHAGMLDRSFILEDRMIAGCGFTISEQPTTGITSCEPEERGRKTILHLNGSKGPFDVSVIDYGEAQRFVGFLLRKNPGMKTGIKPKGGGTLKDLGA